MWRKKYDRKEEKLLGTHKQKHEYCFMWYQEVNYEKHVHFYCSNNMNNALNQ